MVQSYFFCGICGSGMSPLALYLASQGEKIYGSDRSFNKDSDIFKHLKKADISLCAQDGKSVTKDIDFFVVSSAIEENVPDFIKAKELNIKIITRSQLLANIFHEFDSPIAIAGTSGKTTITAMTGFLLNELSQKPSIINGGIMSNFADKNNLGNVIYNKGKFIVIEADESDGSIKNYKPEISLISNITKDHKPISELLPLFENFAQKAKKSILNIDCDKTHQITNKLKNKVTYSVKNKNADFYATNISYDEFGTDFEILNSKTRLNVCGEHNLSNAIGALTIISTLGLDIKQAAYALKNFKGTKRRLELIGEKNNIKVIDDFAHNPDKIRASLQSLKINKNRIIVIYQPHGFAPTKFLKDELIESFANNLNKQDIMIMSEIFFAGGTTNKNISSKEIIDNIKVKHSNSYFFEKRSEIRQFIKKISKPEDRIIIMGARDNSLTDFAKSILQEL